ncbi:MAG: YfcE family phosphodiesterase [Candidatus Omnitrophica bacterium]|nr:YfcE family phosphodiesterase [Candidatus Omnitrophota bacterium]
MRVAVLSDAHANLPALEAVLKDVEEQGIEEIWYLGDFVGYGPYPQKVVDRLKSTANVSIVGNYDLNVLKFPGKKTRWKKTKDPSKYFSFNWTDRQWLSRSKKYMKELSSTMRVEKEGQRFLLVHGSPDKIDEPLKKDTPRKRFAELAKTADADVVLCGHTHEFFDKSINRVRFINPGSVGRPFDSDPRASYAILEAKNGQLTVYNKRLDYNVNKVLRKMKKEKFPKDIIQSIKEGKSLDDVKQQSAGADEKTVIAEVLKLARSCDYEQKHSHQVTKLALKLFDQLKDLHKLDSRRRILLQSASLLHDIGWIKGRVRHHKTSRDIILKSFSLPLTKEEKLIVAMVARYHRRALPKDSHKYYGELSSRKKEEINKLAGMLRLADGLDRSHVNAVKNLKCLVKTKKIILEISSNGFSDWDQESALKKSDLFQYTFKRNVHITVRKINEKK